MGNSQSGGKDPPNVCWASGSKSAEQGTEIRQIWALVALLQPTSESCLTHHEERIPGPDAEELPARSGKATHAAGCSPKLDESPCHESRRNCFQRLTKKHQGPSMLGIPRPKAPKPKCPHGSHHRPGTVWEPFVQDASEPGS